MTSRVSSSSSSSDDGTGSGVGSTNNASTSQPFPLSSGRTGETTSNPWTPSDRPLTDLLVTYDRADPLHSDPFTSCQRISPRKSSTSRDSRPTADHHSRRPTPSAS